MKMDHHHLYKWEDMRELLNYERKFSLYIEREI